MLKNILRRMAQRVLGFDRYLFVFSIFNINRIRVLKAEKAFRFFMGMVPNEGAILDIGANIGINTVLLAKRFPGAVVHAFEPVQENYAALEKTVRFYGVRNVRLYNTALGDTPGQATMIMPQHHGSRMQGWSRMTDGKEVNGTGFVVPVARLDDIRGISNITAIKIDVENFEYFVLKGGTETLRNNKPIVFCELWNDARKEPCLQLMRGLGYEAKILVNGRLVQYNGEDVLDYFFVHKGD
ncbi:FkbM family methyltransferase [Sediminibacterium roseum]|uniref:FkbM family methyltransferase n=1 Tax=Sediminibacterium roseum TaxID=1978412 RepID=A0ABW9ZUN7_9BACT|nr:FkbM family methyltransferase [Sediminibacterium roseum]NCI50868.1 FkbM family methyltransferase [Sediminibacterium roseum]